jgi:protein TonB
MRLLDQLRASSELTRWTASFVFVAAAHGGVALAMLSWKDTGLLANAPAILVDLAPVASSPEITPADLTVGPQQQETPPEAESPPPESAVQIEQPKPPEIPPEKKKAAKLTTAPAPADKRAPVAAPMSGAFGSSALSNWKSMLVGQLERSKRYPSDARSRGEQGVTQLAFSVDRSGGVHGARIVRSSGYSALDQETLALVHRASPLPPPPPEMRGNSISVVVPIRYNIR